MRKQNIKLIFASMTPHKDFEPEIHLVLINIPFKNINWDRKKAGKLGEKLQ